MRFKRDFRFQNLKINVIVSNSSSCVLDGEKYAWKIAHIPRIVWKTWFRMNNFARLRAERLALFGMMGPIRYWVLDIFGGRYH